MSSPGVNVNLLSHRIKQSNKNNDYSDTRPITHGDYNERPLTGALQSGIDFTRNETDAVKRDQPVSINSNYSQISKQNARPSTMHTNYFSKHKQYR